MTLPSPTSSTVQRPVRVVLTDGIYDAVKEQLMDLTITPGALINMARLARDLDVSTTPLREALARLEAEGLVTVRPLQGYRASPILNTTGVDELFSVRVALEPLAAAGAAGNVGEELGALLDRSIDEMARVADAGNAPEGERYEYQRYRAFADQDAAFHTALAEWSGNTLLARTIDGLHAHVHLYRLYFGAGIAPETEREHEAIRAAVRRGDAEGSAAAMRRHLERSWRRLQPRRGPA